jgi:predicted nucleotidyltransferase
MTREDEILQLLQNVFEKERHRLTSHRVVLFGSSAKGTARPNSDIDLALYGDLDDLTVERIAMEMDELPLPYLMDIKAVATLKNHALIDHIQRVGVNIYP